VHQDTGLLNRVPDVLPRDAQLTGGFRRVVEEDAPREDVVLAGGEVAPFSEADERGAVVDAGGEEQDEEEPNGYGYYAFDWGVALVFCVSLVENYT
jgi:hypothetical protein